MDLKKTRAYTSAILYASIVGLSFLGTKTCLEVTTPLVTLVWRYNAGCLGGILLIIFGFVRIRLKDRNYKNLLLTAAFYIGFMGIQTLGLKFATSIEGSIVFAMVPIFAQGVAYFMLKEKTTVKQNIFIIVSIAGIVLMYTWGTVGQGSLNPSGLFILLISSLLMSISNVFMRYVRAEFKAMEVGCCIVIMGCILFNLVYMGFSLFEGTFTLSEYISPFKGQMKGAFILAILYLGIPCMLFTSSLITYALSHIEAVKVTLIGNFSLVIAVIAGMIIRNEPFLLYHFICTFIIIAGVVGTNISSMKNNNNQLK